MLGLDGYIGVKTGITEAAGPCLASCYEKNGHCFVVILLQCKTMEARWEEVQRLVDWAIQRKALLAPNQQGPRYENATASQPTNRQVTSTGRF